jgi:hypothetical protein
MATYAGSGVPARALLLSLAGMIVVDGCAGGGLAPASPQASVAGSAAPPAPAGGPGGAVGAGAGSSNGSGGSPQDACAELTPSFGPAIEALFDAGSPADCALATARSDGQVALGVAGRFGTTSGIAVDLRSPTSATLGRIQLSPVPFGGGSSDVDPWFHGTSSGYHAIVYDLVRYQPLVFRTFRTFDASGRQLADLGQLATSSAPDGQGGSVVLAQDFRRALRSGGPSHAPQYVPVVGPMLLEWVDAAGGVTRSVEVGGNPAFVVVNQATGHTVAIGLGAAAQARWFDATGQPLTPWFTVGDVTGTSIRALLDGTVVLSDDGPWDVALKDGVSQPFGVPAWLAARPFTRLATIRGGRGYAVVPLDATSGDAARVEIVTASGQSCGTFAVPAPTITATDVSTPRRLDVGQDGTLLQQVSSAVPGPGGTQCVFQWWPALLR